MKRLLNLIGRLFAVLIGYVAAALATAIFLHIAAWPVVGLLLEAGVETGAPLGAGLALSVFFVAIVLSGLAFPTALIAIVATEIFAVRHWLFHVLWGVVAAFQTLVILRTLMAGGADPLTGGYGPMATAWMHEIAASGAAAGMVGGAAYWLVAGRRAGDWRNPDVATISAAPSGS